ncbi:M23 family metallopeptidase [Antribacter sp. KLBMP9083]|uniref:M23 family metallopeptidase n=1 Tax=Antribacter soli TaxID=2910976 RepID=A0AA41UDA9_9MICO|nr:M23 family metallopeptidase [Antribacter soli]MCF4122909.1 M23 family metallopeptidase [Antribacter soli]
MTRVVRSLVLVLVLALGTGPAAASSGGVADAPVPAAQPAGMADAPVPAAAPALGAGGQPSVAGQATGYVPPVPGVDPPHGVVRHFDPPEEDRGPGHRGVDLASAPGQAVVSPGPGVVTFAGQVAGRGVVVLTHPDGLRSSLEPVVASVPVGTAVAAGGPVASVEGAGFVGGAGASHCAPDTCVHWGVRRGERYLDPLTLLDRPVIVLLPDSSG